VTAPTTIRASSLPLVLTCPGALGEGLRVDPVSESADTGTAAHDLLRSVAEGRGPDYGRVPEVAAEYQADPDELRFLLSRGATMWRQLGLGAALTEVPMSAEIAPGLVLTGRPDAVVVAGRHATVLDWKAGFLDRSYREQMLGYAALILHDAPEVEDVTAIVAWLREGEVERHTLTREQLPAWSEGVASTVLGWSGTHHPGEHCGYCPRAHDCPARFARAKSDAGALLGMSEPLDLSTASDADLMRLHAISGDAARLAESVRAALRALVAGGRAVTHDEHALVLAEESRRDVDALRAWPVLEEHGFEADDLAACVVVSASKAEKVVAAKAGKGRGAGAARALAEALDAAGAISRRSINKLVKRRV
jgi:hypothetical protein